MQRAVGGLVLVLGCGAFVLSSVLLLFSPVVFDGDLEPTAFDVAVVAAPALGAVVASGFAVHFARQGLRHRRRLLIAVVLLGVAAAACALWGQIAEAMA